MSLLYVNKYYYVKYLVNRAQYQTCVAPPPPYCGHLSELLFCCDVLKWVSICRACFGLKKMLAGRVRVFRFGRVEAAPLKYP